MSQLQVIEGEVDFVVPAAGKPCKTWYKVIGDLQSKTPLVALHGGPGCAHEYLLVLADLTSSLSIPVVLYDQIGNGQSTHLPEKNGDGSFWTEQLFLDELDNLLTHLGIKDNYDLLGHSWGGMLAARHAVQQPKGLKRLILSDSPGDMRQWVAVQNELRTKLPQDIQEALTKHEAAGTTSDKEYTDAVEVFYARHVCILKPIPADVQACFAWIDKDPTVYLTMNGPSEFHVIGTLKDWTILDELHKINVPTLLLNGRYDEAQDVLVAPFFRAISKVKWYTFAESSHCPQHEERARFMEIVGGFLTNA